jgi:hypothetical protein
MGVLSVVTCEDSLVGIWRCLGLIELRLELHENTPSSSTGPSSVLHKAGRREAVGTFAWYV